MEPTKRETARSASGRPEEAAAAPASERYEEIVTRLGQLVERLEGGGLSLEEAIAAFEQGIKLARAGSAKLDDAERRVEMLLEGDRTEPFEASRAEAPPAARPSVGRARRGGGEDIPF